MRAYGFEELSRGGRRRGTKNLFCKKRSHDKPITFSHLPESTAGIGTLSCDRLSRHHRAGPSASLDKSVALFSCWVSLYHSRAAVSIGNLHEIASRGKLATCPTTTVRLRNRVSPCLTCNSIWQGETRFLLATTKRGDLFQDRLIESTLRNLYYAGSGAGFGLLLDGVGASGAGLLGLGGTGGVPLGLSSFGSSSPFHTFSKSS